MGNVPTARVADQFGIERKPLFHKGFDCCHARHPHQHLPEPSPPPEKRIAPCRHSFHGLEKRTPSCVGILRGLGVETIQSPGLERISVSQISVLRRPYMEVS